MSDDATDADLGGVATLLRRTFDAKAAAADVVTPPVHGLSAGVRMVHRRRPARWLAAAASLLVVAGAGGVAARRAATTDDVRAVTRPDAPAPVPAQAEDVADEVTWFLPVPAPAGYEVTDVSAIVLDPLPWQVEDASPTTIVDQPDAPTAAPANGPIEAVFLTLNPISGVPGQISITMTNAPFDPPTDADERRTIDGIEYAIYAGTGEAGAQFTMMTWETGGRHGELTGQVPVGAALAVAQSLQPVSRHQAATQAGIITARAMTLPTLGSATFADGVSVSARRPVDGSDAIVALCVEAPAQRCLRPANQTTLAGGGQPVLYEVFTIQGDRRIIGWHASQPEIGVVGGDDAEVVGASTGSGWFVSVPVHEGEELPTLSIDGADSLILAVSLADVIRP